MTQPRFPSFARGGDSFSSIRPSGRISSDEDLIKLGIDPKSRQAAAIRRGDRFGPHITPQEDLIGARGGFTPIGARDDPRPIGDPPSPRTRNPFTDLFEEEFPRAIFASRVGQLGRPFGQQQRLTSLFGSVYDQFLASQFRQAEAGQPPGGTFTDFLSGGNPFSDFGGFDQFVGGLTPSQRGLFSSPFAPRTQFNFGGQGF